MIDLESARKILDFSKRIGKGQREEEQLEGAVAIHNLLDRHGVAYLADEVGMGKTYVALGALAIFRHINPGFRVLVIAPRENIQKKWMKEFHNFVRSNYLLADLRVKTLNQRPARPIVSCNNLLELVHESGLDPDRDFFARLSSFSLAVGGKSTVNPDEVRRMRDRLRQHLPWVRDEVFDLRNKQVFKDNFASALCCALPVFDLVIVDEAHNLKHGFSLSASARNRVLAIALGRDPSAVDTRLFPNYGPRAKRVLLLSATPVEETYRHLWNQLDVFGLTRGYEGLRRDDVSDDEKKQIAGRCLVRRVTTIRVGSENLTKNLYRREWRAGGVAVYDEPIKVTDPKERMTVALAQKKVSELLGHQRFNSSFQIGMLASFESFLETAKLRLLEEEGTFDDSEQTDDPTEREGIDVNAVNRLARSYRRRFNAEMPHPKMDALVNELAQAWQTGVKSLVFVRRVASVKELKRKLDERYDEWLLARLRRELPKAVLPRFEGIVDRYHAERREALERELDLQRLQEVDADRGGVDTFFAWFFRGEGPKKIVSGANIQQRFTQRGTAYATFFEENYVSWVLGCRPGEVEMTLAAALGAEKGLMKEELRARSIRFLPRVKKLARADRFDAVQAAAIEALKDKPGPYQALAQIIWVERFESASMVSHALNAPEIDDWLELRTFFTEIRQRPGLRAALWPEPTTKDLREAFREQEARRQFLSATARLGHGLIDIYVMTVRRLGSMELRAHSVLDNDSPNAEVGPIDEYLALLESEMARSKTERGWTAFDELADVSSNFALILDVNIPEIREEPLAELGTLLGRLLRQQQPVGGMSGQINQTLVRQFRMPGYPLVLITTDLLQEGEDLHTFCSAIYHYGISWTPSAMEQRIGRIDRVRSQTDRRLSVLRAQPVPEQKLQVFFPHLQDTVEVLQVRRVLERMDVFMRLMHEGLAFSGHEERRIDTTKEFERTYRPSTTSVQPLISSFPVRAEHLAGEKRDATAVMTQVGTLLKRFEGLRGVQIPGIAVEWESASPHGSLMGTAKLKARVQPFTLLLDLYGTWPRVRCISPVGRVHPNEREDEVILSACRLDARIGAILEVETRTYDLTVEEDVLLPTDPQHDARRLQALLMRVVDRADRIEQEYLPGLDQPLDKFRDQLEREIVNGN